MHIAKIELENIKSHAASTYSFTRGTTAITGENGSGKTTIIEAIAWALFDLLEYKKEDFIRRGEKKGSVRITIVSGLDEREYVVYRDTGAGYNVTDPLLQTRIADKKEEVFRFLWLHLGLEPGTDLKSLFRQAIGVPQGTFTAIFLEGATERKVAFDRLLKVEEYRQAAEKLRETTRYLDLSVVAIREKVARFEGVLSRSGAVEDEHKNYQEQSLKFSNEIETVIVDLSNRQDRVNAFREQAERVADLTSALEKAEIRVKQAETAFSRADEAAKKVESARAGHEQHLAALEKLRGLEHTRQQRDRLRSEIAAKDTAIVRMNSERDGVNRDLENLAAASKEKDRLWPKVSDQLDFEREINHLRDRVAEARAVEWRIQSITREIDRLRKTYLKNKAALAEAEERSAAGSNLANLEEQNSKLVADIAALGAKLDRDDKFQVEVQNGLCPIFSARCLNLTEGMTLDAFLSSQTDQMRSRMTVLLGEQNVLSKQLELARESQKYDVVIGNLRSRKDEIEAEGKELNEKKTTFGVQQEELVPLEGKLADAKSRLASLGDPQARVRVLEKQLLAEPDLRNRLSVLQGDLTALVAERTQLDEQLVKFKDFDEQWTRFTRERDATAADHRVFITHESEAAGLEARRNDLVRMQSDFSNISSDITAAQKHADLATDKYDPAQHKIEQDELLKVERRLAELRATLEITMRREMQLAAELQHFTEIRTSLAAEFREKERLEKIAETTSFIRDTLKEAAPRVARNYVYHVSMEANLMFREITGNAERTLKWGDDYAILLEEDGYERPFQNLSGGEQMAAALSVRLALLKQLTDIRIAFFDEPTTNLDAERRENLAMQVSRITNFDQLFVISHDDTFDNFVDNHISLQA